MARTRVTMKRVGKGPYNVSVLVNGRTFYSGRTKAEAGVLYGHLSARAAISDSIMKGITPKTPSSGRNQGSFKGRSGSWKKGAGGRFVGSA